VPCGACGRGEFDMCCNGRYTERGIKEIHGYASEPWTVEADYAVKLDPGLAEVGVLMEPTSVVAKAWEQVDRVGARAWFEPSRALVTGAGPIGLLAALLVRHRLPHRVSRPAAGSPSTSARPTGRSCWNDAVVGSVNAGDIKTVVTLG
jgi:threonine dehydrogenase-like Zn-dependent dehydrogenase